MSLQSYFLDLLSLKKKPVLAVVAAEDLEVLIAIDFLVRQNIVDAILFGNVTLMERMISKADLSFEAHLVHADSKVEALGLALETIHKKEASMLVKGKIETGELLKGVLDKETGLRKDKLLSHISVAQLKDRMIVFGDGAMNIKPDLKDKHTIIEQCVEVAVHCRLPYYHVGVICALEKVNPKMPCTEVAHALKSMNYTHPKVIVDGPFALDNALSIEAAHIKQIQSPIAGNCNILIMDDIECGNIFYKSLAFVAGIEVAGIVMGAQVPVVVTSRADSHVTKVNAILLACVLASSTKAII